MSTTINYEKMYNSLKVITINEDAHYPLFLLYRTLNLYS